ncbi:cysteine-rich small domain-containing protein [Methanococcus voltae]|uniref:Zn-finger protein n=1 Tax=Methanococcus voltae TaxID=2188 RepID=A0A8J7USN4_METVO|nr:cysteine-rich small domain-containing protein [Methanococcus voltae]MBP2172291.1 Zn-finger protein [Methanococcus voltae]MBP2200753.1 Zn-finger protein [Methanococcus voltae]
MIELAKQHLKKVLETSGSNTNCEYYPCHYEGQSCLWCYCPFYPCNDEELGDCITRKDGSKIWSCMKCKWIHKPEIASEVLKQILEVTQMDTIEEAVKKLDEDPSILGNIKKNVENKLGKNNE